MASEFEKLLEDVALAIHVQSTVGQTKAVLKRRLLGLLMAGQAMRDDLLKDYKAHAEWSCCVLESNWDKQKQAALEWR